MSETLKDRLAAMTKERDELICAIRKHRESGDSIVLDNKRLRDGIRRAMERLLPVDVLILREETGVKP